MFFVGFVFWRHMNSKDLDIRIINYLNKKGYASAREIDKFLEPNIYELFDPLKLNNMQAAVTRIEQAITNNQKIVIYGDYDCDGISACVILYNYFKSRNVFCEVYIPNRFEDGYGLSSGMVKELLQTSPDLIITVDLGITAIDEIKELKAHGVDVIVTDHHEPLNTLPDCLVIDPKVKGQSYKFDGLCGAGVALKLVQALSGINEVKKHLDICALATLGDIVPLVSENRIISKLGVTMLNSSSCLKSLKYLKTKLSLEKFDSSNITFRVVPRINACGRMSNAKKVFDFLVETDDNKLSKLYDEIAKDNDDRIKHINDAANVLEKQIKDINISNSNILLLRGEFHQGILGILASRICHDYNRPAIVFTKTEEGTLRGSGRSLEGINLHEALEKVSHLLVRFGGHKMAVGLELKEQDFDELQKALSVELSRISSIKDFAIDFKYDIEITEKDISVDFINQINSLEPFGCKNEKPALMIREEKLLCNQMKNNNFEHFKLITNSGKCIVAFFSEKHIDALKTNAKKQLIVDLEINNFKGKTYPQAILKDVKIDEIKLSNSAEREQMLSLISKYRSLNQAKANSKVNEYNLDELDKLLANLNGNGFGTIVVLDSQNQINKVRNKLINTKSYYLSHIPLKNKQNTLLVSSRYLIDNAEANGYKNIVFTRQIFEEEKSYFAQSFNVYVPKRSKVNLNLSNDRNLNIYIYKLVNKYANLSANNIIEWVEKVRELEAKTVNAVQLLFSLLAFDELGFLKISFLPFNIHLNENPPKRLLNSSSFMNKICGGANGR